MSALDPIRRVSQVRQFTDEPVADEVIDQLLELARWTGSAINQQPWEFIVIRDRDALRKIAGLRAANSWVAAAPAAIAIVLDGAKPMFDGYDEGRVTERLMTGATMLGYGAGVAWFGSPQHDAEAKRFLGIPGSRIARQVVAIGRPKPKPRTGSELPRMGGGRKALRELVSYDHFGNKKR
jgi:hypothetical protein